MRTFVILIAIFGVGLVNSVSFKFPATKPCELLDVDASFDVKATKDGKTTSVKVPATNKTAVSGSCDTPNMSLTFSKGAEWTLTFMKKADKTVELRMTYTFNQSELFPSLNLTEAVVSLVSDGVELSKDTNAYLCKSAQEFKFDPSSSADNKTTFTATLTVQDLHVQAFNVKDGKFGENDECPQDAPDTSAATSDTSTPVTSETTETSDTTETSESTKTTETSIKTTETTKPPTTTGIADNTYKVMEGNTTCILMQAEIMLTIQYETKDKKMAMSKPFSVPSDATATGTCPTNSTESNATVVVEFFDDTIEFFFTDKNGQSTLEMISITVVTDEARFPNASDPSGVLNMTATVKTAQTKDDTFYLCHVGETITFPDKKSTVQLINEKFQAFNVKNNSFNGAGQECSADISSTTPGHTTPKPTPPPGPPSNHFFVSGTDYVCIVMNVSMFFSITYNDTAGKDQTVIIDVPELSESNVTGSCPKNASRETMTIDFFDGWSITWVFSLTGDQQMLGASSNNNYDLANLTLVYVLDEARFPNTSLKGEQTVHVVNENMFQASKGGSYMCKSNVTISGSNGRVNLTTSNLQYKAFQTNSNSTTFSDGNLTECPADTETNSIVPIAVGAALAGLVVIVLIAYLIGRRKSRRAGYESV